MATRQKQKTRRAAAVTPTALSPAKLLPMESRQVRELPGGEGWQFEPKWDGFRCLAVRNGDAVELLSKSGKALTRFFPEIVAALTALSMSDFIVDGELLIPEGDSLSFDALQLRLHPAESRIQKLARETPALFMLFDMLRNVAGQLLLDDALPVRRTALERFFEKAHPKERLRLSPFSRDLADAKRWLSRAGGGALDGVIAKRLDEPYRPGERNMLKIKCLRSADCVVGGFRYETGGREVGSLLLGLFNDQGLLDHVGFTSGFADVDRPALTKKLEALRGGEGFTGNAPGGPSRWSTERSAEWVPLKLKLVAEVRYDHISGGRFRHGTKFLRWRPDKAPKQCTFDQLMSEASPSKLLKTALHP